MDQTRFALHRFQPPLCRRFGLRRAGIVPAFLAAFALVAGVGGCAYRVNVQQGNVVEQESVEQVREGMTRSQVQFLLGTPMIADPFHADRWDYTYYYRVGRSRQVQRRWVSVHFEDDRVERIERHILPDGEREATAQGN